MGVVSGKSKAIKKKVKNAQNAGAIGAIIYNNAANGATLGNMGGADAFCKQFPVSANHAVFECNTGYINTTH